MTGGGRWSWPGLKKEPVTAGSELQGIVSQEGRLFGGASRARKKRRTWSRRAEGGGVTKVAAGAHTHTSRLAQALAFCWDLESNLLRSVATALASALSSSFFKLVQEAGVQLVAANYSSRGSKANHSKVEQSRATGEKTRETWFSVRDVCFARLAPPPYPTGRPSLLHNVGTPFATWATLCRGCGRGTRWGWLVWGN